VIVAVHALTGAALGRFCRTRRQAFAAGFLSHMPCDLAPHRDLEVPQEALLLGSVLALIGAMRGISSREFAGAVGAVAPDIENLVGRALHLPDEKLLLPTHSTYHGRKISSTAGQLLLAAVAFGALCLPRAQPSTRAAHTLPDGFLRSRHRARPMHTPFRNRV